MTQYIFRRLFRHEVANQSQIKQVLFLCDCKLGTNAVALLKLLIQRLSNSARKIQR